MALAVATKSTAFELRESALRCHSTGGDVGLNRHIAQYGLKRLLLQSVNHNCQFGAIFGQVEHNDQKHLSRKSRVPVFFVSLEVLGQVSSLVPHAAMVG